MNDVTARPQDVALLPLPWCLLNLRADDRFAVQDYARANVTAALASAQAREDELRAEVAENEGAIRVWRRRCTKAEARAERLEEALRELFDDYKRLADSGDPGFWKLEDTYAGKKALAALSTNAAQPGETT